MHVVNKHRGTEGLTKASPRIPMQLARRSVSQKQRTVFFVVCLLFDREHHIVLESRLPPKSVVWAGIYQLLCIVFFCALCCFCLFF